MEDYHHRTLVCALPKMVTLDALSVLYARVYH
jgi:hypothetical protein